MRKNDEIPTFRPLLPNVCLRPEALVLQNEGDVAHIDMAAVNHEGTSVSRASCTVKLTRPVEAVLPRASSCDLMEGGLGI